MSWYFKGYYLPSSIDGPGLSLRVIGPITKDKIKILQEADNIFIKKLKEYKLYDDIWQAGVILLPIKSVQV